MALPFLGLSFLEYSTNSIEIILRYLRSRESRTLFLAGYFLELFPFVVVVEISRFLADFWGPYRALNSPNDRVASGELCEYSVRKECEALIALLTKGCS